MLNICFVVDFLDGDNRRNSTVILKLAVQNNRPSPLSCIRYRIVENSCASFSARILTLDSMKALVEVAAKFYMHLQKMPAIFL